MTLQLNHITKQYQRGPETLTVLHDVSLTVKPADTVAIMGPSGCGKTTLLNIIGTLDRPNQGTLTFNDTSLTNLTANQTAQFRSDSLGFIFQDHYLLSQCTVAENCIVPLLCRSDRKRVEQGKAYARKLLEHVGLAERLDHFPAELSGGERQRVAVVRALINKPQLVLADEPTGALDEHTAQRLTELLLELQREMDFMLLVVTHAESLARHMQRRLELHQGQLEEVAQ